MTAKNPSPARTALLGRLWRDHLQRYRLDLLALAPVLAAVAAIGVAYAYIMKQTGDALQRGDMGVAFWAPAAIVVATVARAGAIWAQAVMSQGLGQKVLRDLQNAMFARLTRADFALFSRENSGQMVSRLTNDVNVIAEGLVRAAQAVLRDALTLLGALAAMVWFDWALGLLAIALFAIAGPPLSRIAKRARARSEAQQTMMGKLTALLGESFSSPRLVKTYALEAHEEARAGEKFEERRRVAMQLAKNRASVDPLLEVLGGLALAVVLFVAGGRIVSGAMTIGDLLGMISAIAVAAPAARSLGTFNTVMNEALAALGRVFSVLDEQPAIVDAPNAGPLQLSRGVLAFENVRFGYDEDTAALHGVSFSVARGETVALVGPSGAGKSTIFNLIPRLYDVSAGAVTIDGQNIRDVTLASLRGAIALVSQDVALFDDTVAANIAFGKPGAGAEEIEAAARAAAAHDFIAALPHGYQTQVGERGHLLSGGERQRIALARAFLRDAPILLLDEATSALDADSERQVQHALARLAEGRATLVIAHRLSTVRDAARIVVLEAGRVREIGAHGELLAGGGLYARLARMQFQAEPA